MLKKFIGDKQFYKMAVCIALPIMLQNGITNFVSLLDNIMVGRVGTLEMSSVAIVNQLLFVFQVCIFGVVESVSIFIAQFYGCKRDNGIRDAKRFKIMAAGVFLICASALFILFQDNLINLYLHGEDIDKENLGIVLALAKKYLMIMLIGLIPFTVEQVYSSTLRSCGETVLPMKAGMIAVGINLVINYILIFGSFGAPKLGVVGAAIGTAISRYIQMLIVVIWTHKRTERFPFMVGLYRSMKVPKDLMAKIMKTGAPLILNEFLWASGMTILIQCYSVRGLDVVGGLNISSTISNVFNVVYLALGSAIGVIVGQLLGAGKLKEAKETDTKLIALTMMCCTVLGAILIIVAPLFPELYVTSDTVKEHATWFIRSVGFYMPMYAFIHGAYFTLRAGGKTVATFIFDSVFVWAIPVPCAYILSKYTTIPIEQVYFTCVGLEFIKCILGFIFLKKGIWVRNLISDVAE